MFNDKYITLTSLATSLGLPKKYLEDLAMRGGIPSLRINKRLRFSAPDVRAALTKLATDNRPSKSGVRGRNDA